MQPCRVWDPNRGVANSGCDRSCCSDWIRLSLTLVFVPSGHCWYDKSKIKPCPTHKPINHFNDRKANVKKREKKKKDLLVLPLPLICSCVSGRKDYPLPTGLYHHLPLHPLSPTHSMTTPWLWHLHSSSHFHHLTQLTWLWFARWKESACLPFEKFISEAPHLALNLIGLIVCCIRLLYLLLVEATDHNKSLSILNVALKAAKCWAEPFTYDG